MRKMDCNEDKNEKHKVLWRIMDIAQIIVLSLIIAIVVVVNIDYTKTSDDYKYFYRKTDSEVQKMLERKDSFFLYIGRDSCAYCNALTTALCKGNTNVDIVYLDTQEYKDMIDDPDSMVAEEGQLIYDLFKEKYGYQYVPYLCYVKNGEIIDAYQIDYPENLEKSSNFSKNIFLNKNEKLLTNWISTHSLVKKTGTCSATAACE